MCLRTNFLAFSFFILSFFNSSTSFVSEKGTGENEQCNIAFNTGEIINLSPLFNASQPMILSSTASLYIYHPCTDVPLNAVDKNNTCQNGYGLCYFVPKTATDKPINFKDALSNHTLGNFSLLAVNKEGVSRINQMLEPEMVYKHSNGSDIITTYVRFKCNEKIEKYSLTSEKSTPEHILTLHSKYCCLQTVHYMSGWTVFFIILLVFLALYFIGGVLVLKFLRGATGIEMIPNHEFWCKLPEMARNGIAYMASCGKNTPDSYEKI